MATREELLAKFRASNYSSSIDLTARPTAVSADGAPAGVPGSVAEGERENIFADRPFVSPQEARELEERGESPERTGKLRKFFTDIIGGEQLARGAGMALAAPELQRQLSEIEQEMSNTDLALIKRIQEKAARGEDTTRLEAAREQLLEDMRETRGVQGDFVEALPSNREVLGSAVRLAGTVAAPTIAGKATAGFRAAAPVGFKAGAIAGAKVGAVGGVIEGSIQGLGEGIAEDDVVAETFKGALFGGAGGAILGGLLGGISGAMAKPKTKDNVLKAVTPDGKELTPKQYDELLKQGRITPRTATQPPEYIMSNGENEVALKYSHIIDKDPVITTQNISDTLGELDDEVGRFLSQNNGTFSKGELRNVLLEGLEEVDDLTVDAARLQAKKVQIVENFVDSLDKNDMVNLWEARKAFDQAQNIDKALQGAPTLNKNMKIAFRNTVQNFLADRTTDGVYKGFMHDMSNLYNLQDTVAVKATKARGLSAIQAWMQANPKKAAALKYATAGYIGSKLFFD
jgi:hypothetical protein